MDKEGEPCSPEIQDTGFASPVIERIICSAYDDFADGMCLGVGEEITVVIDDET